MSTFLLSNNGKVGVYGNGDRVYGSGGTEKAIIMNGAENVVVENTVEEIHVANNMAQLTFRVDTNTNEVSVVSGSTVLAKFAPEAAGIKLFTATGMSVIKSVVDTATGEISFTADNGSASATPVPLPTNGSALPSDAIDTNAKSDNAGGTTPTPPVTETTYTVQEAAVALANGDITAGNYILKDDIQDLGSNASILNGAKAVYVKDTVANLTDTENVATSAVLGKASKIIAEDSFENIALKDRNGLTFNELIVNKKVADTVNLKQTDPLTVAEATAAQDNLDALFNDKTVQYIDASGKTFAAPKKAPTLGTYYIEDDPASIANATAKVLSGAAEGGVTVSGTVAEFDTNRGVASDSNVDHLKVSDSLTNILNGDSITIKGLIGNAATFVADDTPTTKGVVNASISSAAFQLDSGGIVLDNAVKVVNLTASNAIGSSASSLFELDKVFGASSSSFTVNFTGSEKSDYIKGHNAGGIFDGNGGNDVIDLTTNSAKDIVVLGSVLDDAGTTKPANVATISNFATGANEDVIDFAGVLNGFGSEGFVSHASAVIEQSYFDKGGDFSAGKNVVFFTNALASAVESHVKEDVTVDFILIAANKSGTDLNVWYVEGNGEAASNFTLVGVLNGALNSSSSSLDATNFTAANFDPFA